MTLDTSSLNQELTFPSAPPRYLVLRAASLTASFYLGLIMLYFFAYYRKNATFALSDFMQLSFLSIGIEILVGMLVIWFVFPRSYSPRESHEFFPKVLWVGRWHLILFPPLFFAVAGISPFDFTHIQDRTHSQIWIDSPILYVLGIADTFALLTYGIFFSALGYWVKNQKPKSSNVSHMS